MGPGGREEGEAGMKEVQTDLPTRPLKAATQTGRCDQGAGKDRKNSQGAGGGNKPALPKVPCAAAVTVSCPAGSYADMMRRARNQIDLGELGIGDLRTRRAVTDTLVLEITGPEGHARADALNKRMLALFTHKRDVRIARPMKRADICVLDLDDAATVEDIISAVAVAESCGPGKIKAGEIRPGPDRMGTLWLRCPLVVAKRITGGGRIRVG
ncbi:uncharacterized protein LOC116853411 [Odontomachus brunneus]|uniref:uncharacterized protein LOC116853411 n=1 Tax=Odontomachus brunneus TaxID=486640 RepID=UPI0013F228CC|nr:uncharacterized protein LOC116853411 [Odontomachus brunneus]